MPMLKKDDKMCTKNAKMFQKDDNMCKKVWKGAQKVFSINYLRVLASRAKQWAKIKFE